MSDRPMVNDLLPEPAPSASGPQVHPQIAQAHQSLAGAFAQTGKEMAQISRFETALAPLLAKGDTVNAEDVTEAAGKLVGQGEAPEMLAAILADMPQGPGALAGWLKQHTQMLAQAKAQLAPVHEAMRHQLGVHSLHALMGISLAPQSQAPAMNPASTGPNLLAMPPAGNA